MFLGFFCLPSWENSWFLALNCVSLVTQFLVSWLLALNCVSLVTQFLVSWLLALDCVSFVNQLLALNCVSLVTQFLVYWFLALNFVSLVTQFLVSWLLALNCVSLVTQLRKFWITWFNLCIFGYPILSFLITCYWLFKVHAFVISNVPFCSVGGFLAVLNCVLIDLSYVLYERLLICLRINWECELLPVGQCIATLWYVWVKLHKTSVLL